MHFKHFEGDLGGQGKSSITEERQMLHLPSKEVNRSIWETIGWSASLLFLWEKFGLSGPGAHFWAHVGENIDWEQTELVYQEW